MTDHTDVPEHSVVVDNDMMLELARITDEVVRQMHVKVGAAGFDGISYVAVSAVFATALHKMRRHELVCTCEDCDETVRALATEIDRRLSVTTYDAATRGQRMN